MIKPFKQFLLVWFGLVFIGITVIMIAAITSGFHTTGTAIFVGPFPTILGVSPYSILAIMLAIFLAILGVIFFFTLMKQ